MRGLKLLLLGAVLASCAAATPQPLRSAKNEQRYQSLLAGKVAQAPISCIPPYRANDMIIIDDSTLVFQSYGNGRVYVAHMQGPCNMLGSGPYALVTRQFGGTGLCRGDIASVTDTLNHIAVGSCVFGDFVPYVRSGY